MSTAVLLDYWPVDVPVTTYHVLAIPPATPPLAYDLQLQIYVDNGTGLKTLDLLDEQGAPQGQSTMIGKTHVTYKEGAGLNSPEDLPIMPWDEPVQVGARFDTIGG